MIKHTEGLSEADKKKLSIEKIEVLKKKYKDFSPQLSKLKFFTQNDNLGNNQAFLIVIDGQKLSIAKFEENKDALYQKIITFCDILNGEISPVVENEKKGIEELVYYISTNPLVKKDNLRFRDINIILIAFKNIFSDNTQFTKDISHLRSLIHKKELGKKRFQISFEGLELDISKDMGNGEILLELFHFAHKIYSKHPEKFKDFLERTSQIRENEPKDRQEIWSVILAGLSGFKKSFHGSDFGAQIAELKDAIDSFQVGGGKAYRIETEWHITLDISSEDDRDQVVEKLTLFIEAVQKANAEKIPAEKKIDAKKIIENKEGEKIFWRDVIAGIEMLQNQKFSVKKYPQLESLKEMIEKGELGKESLLILIDVDGVKLDILRLDTEKTMKNKVLTFLGDLKQKASEKVDKEREPLFWRDLLIELKGLEDAYGDIADYQLLMMVIESGTLGTVKEFKTVIDGIPLDINPEDSDRTMREKIQNFIQALKKGKDSKINQKEMDRMRTRIEQMEREQEAMRKAYEKIIREQQEKLRKAGEDIVEKDKKIKKLKDDAESIKQIQSYRPSYSG